MHKKRFKLYCILTIICLLTSFIFLDDFKTDNMVSFSCERTDILQNQAGRLQIYSADCSISEEDACTLEMLGNTYINLLNQHQTATYKSESQRNSETRFLMLSDTDALQSPFQFYISACSSTYSYNSDVADILHCIHDKDGKKRI